MAHLGISAPPTWGKPDKCATLAGLPGLELKHYIDWVMSCPSTPHTAPLQFPREPKIDIKQEKTENIIDFLDRFETTMVLHAVADANKTKYLQLALIPSVATLITGLPGDSLRSYILTKQALLTALNVDRLSYLQLATSSMLRPDETYNAFATRLRRYYFLSTTNQVSVEADPVATVVLEDFLLARLIAVAPKTLQAHIRTFIGSNIRPLQQVLAEMDAFASAHRPTDLSPSSNNRLHYTCRIHGPGHSDAYCRTQRSTANTNNTISNTALRTGLLRDKPGRVQCYKCNQLGHVSRDCPTLANSPSPTPHWGNAKPGSA
jgi:hypothetical protein